MKTCGGAGRRAEEPGDVKTNCLKTSKWLSPLNHQLPKCSAPTANTPSCPPSPASLAMTIAGVSFISTPGASSREAHPRRIVTVGSRFAPHMFRPRPSPARSRSALNSGKPLFPVHTTGSHAQKIHPGNHTSVQRPLSQVVECVNIRDQDSCDDCPVPIHFQFNEMF